MLFPQLHGKCQGKARKDGARPALFLIFVVLCIVCVYMCTVLLPPGGYPTAVNKYIISIPLCSCTWFIKPPGRNTNLSHFHDGCMASQHQESAPYQSQRPVLSLWLWLPSYLWQPALKSCCIQLVLWAVGRKSPTPQNRPREEMEDEKCWEVVT